MSTRTERTTLTDPWFIVTFVAVLFVSVNVLGPLLSSATLPVFGLQGNNLVWIVLIAFYALVFSIAGGFCSYYGVSALRGR